MRVFVTGTGRCGSTTFAMACRHVSNYGSGHETVSPRLEYPDPWIEVSPHIRCAIPYLARRYPGARWVHLVREPEECIASLAALDGGAVVRAWQLMYRSLFPEDATPADVAWRYYWHVNDMIRTELAATVRADRRREVTLGDWATWWPRFWDWVGAEGDYPASLRQWKTRYNSSRARDENLRREHEAADRDSVGGGI